MQEAPHEGGPDPADPRARVRPELGRNLPAAQHHRPDLLPLKDLAGHDDQLGRPAPAHAREGQQGAQADGRRPPTGEARLQNRAQKNSEPAGSAGAPVSRPRDVLRGQGQVCEI